MILTEAFYWDMDDASRAFSQRFLKRAGHMPTMIQAGIYSVTHYLEGHRCGRNGRGQAGDCQDEGTHP